jgi:hypothetical protein
VGLLGRKHVKTTLIYPGGFVPPVRRLLARCRQRSVAAWPSKVLWTTDFKQTGFVPRLNELLKE